MSSALFFYTYFPIFASLFTAPVTRLSASYMHVVIARLSRFSIRLFRPFIWICISDVIDVI